MNSLFNSDNYVFRFLGRITDCLILNLLFILCSIPIVTIGPAVCALYYCMMKIVRDRDSSITRMFFRSFRLNLRQGILMTLLFLAMALILVVDIRACDIFEFSASGFIQIMLYILSFILFAIASYVFPLLAQFDNTVRNTFKNAFYMALTNCGYTMIIIVLNSIPLILFLFFPELFILTVPLWLSFGFAIIAIINAKMFVNIFNKYIPENEE